MNKSVQDIGNALSAALETNMERVRGAGNLLSSTTPVTENMVEDMFNGLAACIMGSHALAVHSGWWTNKDGTPIDAKDPHLFGTKIALIHSEISEAMEGGRKGLDDSHLPHRKALEVELADALIRIFDLAGAMNLELADAVIEKLAYNQQRADHKPENRFAEGGKVF